MAQPTIAVLGTGSIGSRHLAVLRTLGISSIAVPVRSERARELTTEGYAVAASLEEAAGRGALAAVIATDTLRHAADSEEAMKVGMDVLCEKPLAESWPAASRLPALANELGRKLYAAYCLRFDPGLEEFRSGLATIGEIHAVRIECRSFLPDWHPGRNYRKSYSARESEGGVLRDLSHELDYACWLFGMPDRVSGTIINTGRLGIESEEIAEAFWIAPGCPCVSIALDYLSNPPARFVRASGSAGEIEYDFLARRLILRSVGHPSLEEQVPGDRGELYPSQMRQFLKAIAGGEMGKLTSAQEGLRVLALCDAWRRAADSGHREALWV